MIFKITLFTLTIATTISCVIAQQTVVVRPVETDELLVNPGMGITTFQRFNDQDLNQGVRWSEEGPTSLLSDASSRPEFPGTSVAYLRWFWTTIEPERGSFRWDVIDQALGEAHRHGQRLAIRIMPYDQGHPLPEWYRNSGARRANKSTDKDGAIWQPDFTDPLYLRFWGELVSAAAARYDGHPYLDSVDISSIGYWGEGWSDYMPNFQDQKPLIDIYLDSFKRTPLLMNFDEPHALAYGTERGAGWRLDCWGDMRGEWKDKPHVFSHMLDFYPQQIVRTGIQDVWRHSPVSLETCWVPQYWKEKGWDIDYILNQAIRWHVSTVNVKSSKIPPEWRGKFDDFQKRIGYRLILRRFEYPGTVKAGRMMPVHAWFLNAGVAPLYRDYRLAVEIRSSSHSEVIDLPVDLRKWLPGDAVFDGTLFVPDNLPPGAYRLRLAVLDPRTRLPAIQLAIKGRESDGWYAMGEVTIE